jgi:hypothetical protein
MYRRVCFNDNTYIHASGVDYSYIFRTKTRTEHTVIRLPMPSSNEKSAFMNYNS